MGALDYLSNFITISGSRKKRKPLQTVEIKVKIDCEGCEKKVKDAVSSMKGVRKVEVNRKQHKVTVSGYVEANKVLKKVQSTGKKKAEFWPYVPYNLVYYPYAPQSYDKKAPAGHVKKLDYGLPSPTTTQERYTSLFSDDNPHACTIM